MPVLALPPVLAGPKERDGNSVSGAGREQLTRSDQALDSPPWRPWSCDPGDHSHEALIRASLGAIRVLSLSILSQLSRGLSCPLSLVTHSNHVMRKRGVNLPGARDLLRKRSLLRRLSPIKSAFKGIW